MAKFLLYGLVVYLLAGIRIVKSDQWLVITRNRKYRGFRRQGLHWVMPIVDQTMRVDLSQVSEGWASTPEEILETKVQQWLLSREASQEEPE